MLLSSAKFLKGNRDIVVSCIFRFISKKLQKDNPPRREGYLYEQHTIRMTTYDKQDLSPTVYTITYLYI